MEQFAASDTPVDDAGQGAMLRVLVVDDEALMRASLCRLVEAAFVGHVVVRSAATMRDALARSASFRPHLVLLDVDLSGFDGLELVGRLRLGANVLVLTGGADPALRRRARRLGAGGFVSKQDPAEVLLRQLRALATPHLQGEQSHGAACAGWPPGEGSFADAGAAPQG